MSATAAKLDASLARIDSALVALASSEDIVTRLRADAAAAAFHLRRNERTAGPPLVVIIGGTGTGKSTLVNRLLEQTVTAASFRRTFTAGCVAVTGSAADVPAGWLGIEHVVITDLPARGAPDQLAVVPLGPGRMPPSTLIDTPDLDGDFPAHHAQADRAFRWATAVIFVVTPEKYQMTEVLPYYRLAGRYGLPAAFVMNKAEESVVVEDYRELLARRDWPNAPLFAIPRDDAAFEPSSGATLADLRHWLSEVPRAVPTQGPRLHDFTSRLRDQLLTPLRETRKAVDAVVAQLRAMETPPAGVDVNPLTQQLQRRLQQRSVLYLIGPQRVLDRARQIPSMLARLPRATWDYLAKGELPKNVPPPLPHDASTVPDFRQLLADSLAIVRTRIDDAVRSSPALEPLTHEPGYARQFLAPEQAGAIADEELANLQRWLEDRWNANPRDTRILQKLLKALPGGERLSQWSEAAPYLLAVVVATHHAFFGPVDLIILGGYSLAAWATERLSNEVTARTRATNHTIAERFTDLAHAQVEQICRWLDAAVPSKSAIDRIEQAAVQLEEGIENGRG
jgi:hypothetical protein